jgi:hypothetical protein
MGRDRAAYRASARAAARRLPSPLSPPHSPAAGRGWPREAVIPVSMAVDRMSADAIRDCSCDAVAATHLTVGKNEP